MTPANVPRSFQVRTARTSPNPVRFVRGRVSGLVPQEGSAVEASLHDLYRAAALGMFALDEAAAVALRMTPPGSGIAEFTWHITNQHLSMLRVFANIVRTRLATRGSGDIELELLCYESESSSTLADPELVFELEAVPYLTNYESLPFRIELVADPSGWDRVVRIYFERDLGDEQFEYCRGICRFWDTLLAAGAYSDGSRTHPPFVQDELEAYLMAPNVFEHVVVGLHQSEACLYGLFAALRGPALADSPIRRVELE